jgi:hypothetical protein
VLPILAKTPADMAVYDDDPSDVSEWFKKNHLSKRVVIFSPWVILFPQSLSHHYTNSQWSSLPSTDVDTS